jgi:hypothetical protein
VTYKKDLVWRCIDQIYGDSFWDNIPDKHAAKTELEKVARG